ncbi:hypothetical protein AGRA3207_007246 [Actinomadura graeca]|uniref:Secreted protein n=1 Tax=Actinomadura graeca TaxID=2750812 RepID=A0ABX8R6Z3_9ACTN|nr:hypothetical protein [Actinomadura graeca]QXJ25717.1 hypothetical protein AGRA3207_007246 [Actinomadura graeca]
MSGPGQSARRVLGSTRAELTAWTLLLALALAATAAAGLLADRAVRAGGRDRTSDAAEMSGHAQVIHRSLAEAGTAATGGFLAGPRSAQRTVLEQQYRDAVSETRTRLAASAALAGGDPGRARSVARIALMLPRYTALVAKAEDLNRYAGTDPKRALLGAAYLRESTAYLRTALLPATLQLWQEEIERLSRARGDARSAIGLLSVLVLGSLAALGWAQRRLWLRFRRVFNLGLVGATVLLAGAGLWLMVALRDWPCTDERLGTVGRLLAGQRARVETERRSLDARADDYLRLGGNGNDAGAETLRTRFRTKAGCDRPDRWVPAATAGVIRTWCTAYDEEIDVRERQGQHEEAVAAALPGGRVAVAYQAVDADLTRLIGDGETGVRDEVGAIPRAPGGVGETVGGACLAGALLTAAGVWTRIRDYL